MFCLLYVDWTCMGNDIGSALIKWIYTDQVDFSKGEDFTLELIKIANEYRLEDLISKWVLNSTDSERVETNERQRIISYFYRCENALMVLVNKKNCVRFYTTADEINAETLKQHCSSLISTHWVKYCTIINTRRSHSKEGLCIDIFLLDYSHRCL